MDWLMIKLDEMMEKRHTSRFPQDRGHNNDKVFKRFMSDLNDKSISDEDMITKFDAFPFNLNEIGGILMFYPEDNVRGMKVAQHIIKKKINPSNVDDYYDAYVSYWHSEHDGFSIKYEQGRHWGHNQEIYEMLLAIKEERKVQEQASKEI